MKTPIQELFSQLEVEHPELFNVNTSDGKSFIHSYHKFIELEKENLKKTWTESQENMHRQFSSDAYKPITFEQYYSEAYER